MPRTSRAGAASLEARRPSLPKPYDPGRFAATIPATFRGDCRDVGILGPVSDVVWHKVPEERWPTAEEAARGLWFRPLALGPVTARHRTWVPAMVPWRATDDGLVTPNVLDWYRRFARGRPGVLVVEATGIRDIPSGPLLRVGHDRFLPGLRELVRTVKEASGGETLLFLQIIDFLAIKRRPGKEKFFGRFLRVTDAHLEALRGRLGGAAPDDEAGARQALLTMSDDELREVLSAREFRDYAFGYREEVNDLELDHVRELPRVLPQLFADAAARTREAGFDGVELHYAHAYTMASFLSRTNVRTDGYGGSPENRLRLPLEVYRAVRARVGGQYCVGVRYLGDEAIEGGSHLDDAVQYGVAFARAGLDYLSVSKGGKFDDARQPRVGEAAYPYTGPSGVECMPPVRSDARGPFGRNVPLAAAIRRALRAAGCTTPVVTSGGICMWSQAERILADGEADAVAAARQSLADPDWFTKIRLGRGAEVRRCKFTNYCEGLDQRHKEVTCQLWDREFDGDEAPRSKDGKRRLLAPDWRA
jgi:2,4-dienoyl-CoA reductase-like NADH-dependent reductase (Old Yellow Enzyme family)